MNQFIKKRIIVFAMAVSMIVGFGSTSSLTVYAANTAVTAETKQVEALKSYKGNTSTFNAYDYYMNNTDLQTAIGADGDALLKHFNEYGKKEGRVAIAAKTVTAVATATTTASKSSANSSASSESSVKSTSAQQNTEVTYVLNTNTHKFHYPKCKDTQKIKEKNYATTSASRDDVIAQGYSPCGHCHP